MSREIIVKKWEGRGLSVSDFKLYFHAVNIKTLWYWLKDRKEGQQNMITIKWTLEHTSVSVNPKIITTVANTHYLIKFTGKTGNQSSRN